MKRSAGRDVRMEGGEAEVRERVSVHTWLFDGGAVRMHHTRVIGGKRETIRGVETDRPANWWEFGLYGF